ncbi:hypothetical protein H6798_02130 [Candidatus Nomurabacteria bacterium]|nr:hypothetical protein [Candidatus Nomurabacteria bacterium]
MDGGKRKDVGNALLKRLQGVQATNRDIGEIWRSRNNVKNKELAEDAQKKQKAKQIRQKRLKQTAARTKNILKPNKQKATVVATLLAIVIFANTRGTNNIAQEVSKTTTTVLGDQSSQEDIPKVDSSDLEFQLLYPNGDPSNYTVRKINPPNTATTYTYIVSLDKQSEIYVSQQQVPDNFDLAKVATDFQATNIIEVDSVKLYSGISEKQGIQSVVFIKDNTLFLIKSPTKLSDDEWVSFYLSLR